LARAFPAAARAPVIVGNFFAGGFCAPPQRGHNLGGLLFFIWLLYLGAVKKIPSGNW